MGNKLKNDIKYGRQMNLFEDIPEIEQKHLSFYRVGRTTSEHKNVFLIDIKNAYPTVLFNHGMCSKKTMDSLMKATKENRLASIGSLASKKHIFEMENGELTNFFILKSEFEKYFYFACKIIEDLMHELSLIAKSYFLYSWVDCIYLDGNTPRGILNEIQTYIRNKRYNCTLEIGKDFSMSENKNSYHVSFINEKGNSKVFRFPKNNEQFLRLLSEAVLSDKANNIKS